MPKLSEDRVPSYSRHRASGQAIVTLDGKDIYLGKYNTAESRQKYNRIIGEWLANGRHLPVKDGDLTIVEIIARFKEHAETYYRNLDGSPTGEWESYKIVLHQLRLAYGTTPAIEFGPLALKALRNRVLVEHEIEDRKTKQRRKLPGWSRTYTNRQMARVKHVFKWAVGEQLIPASVHQALTALEGLRRGRSDARETEAVRPVPEANVTAILPLVSRQVRAMIELQLMTGARGGELFQLRACDIAQGSAVWVYKPVQHKTLHHGHAREIRFGRRAQEIIEKFLKPDVAAFLFSPADAERQRREQMHKDRKTPLSCGNVPGSNRVARPKRVPKDHYTSAAYARAIARACVAANVPHWHPHQLRHTAATNIRRDFGREAAKVLLGERTERMVELYAERDGALADRVVAEVG